MHDGFPNRCTFEEISLRFQDLLPASFQRYDRRTFIEALMLAYDVPRSDWVLGMSRLFLKSGQLRALNDLRYGGAQPEAEKLVVIVSAIVRKRWNRAVHAIRLCNWLPSLLAQIHARRAIHALCQVTAVTARLALPLNAAKHRVAKRRHVVQKRWRRAVSAVQCLRVLWADVRVQRLARLARMLYLACFLAIRSRPWIKRARERAESRRLEDQCHEQQRLRLEEERKSLEQKRALLEAQRLEDERLRQDMDQRQRQESDEFERNLQKDQKSLDDERKNFEQKKKIVYLIAALPIAGPDQSTVKGTITCRGILAGW